MDAASKQSTDHNSVATICGLVTVKHISEVPADQRAAFCAQPHHFLYGSRT